MKKVFTLLAGLMMLSASAANLTVYEGNATSLNLPICSNFMDWAPYTHQVIYPESELAALMGQEITSVKYYVDNETGSTLKDGKVALYMGTTTQSQFSLDGYGNTSFISGDGLTKVAEMTMTVGLNEIEFTFDNAWTYNGGNIVVQTVIEEDGIVSGSEGTNFLGQSTSAAYAATGKSTARPAYFVPKTTFTYGGGDTPQPEYEIGDVNHDHSVSIADVTALIDLLLGGSEAPAEADVNGDTNVSIADVTALIDKLLSGN